MKKPKQTTKPRTTSVPKIDSITASTTNINAISAISTSKTGRSSAVSQSVLNSYYGTVKRLITGNWVTPTNTDLATKVSFTISSNGMISNLRIVKSSGNAEFDNSVLEAIRKTTLPPPPTNETLNVNITFNLN